MNKYFLVLFLGFYFFSSCRKNKLQSNCKLKSVLVGALIYDEYQFCSSYNPNALQKLNFEYDDKNRISLVSGGLTPVYCQQSYGMWILWDSAYEQISYNEQLVTSQHFTFPGSQVYQVREYLIKDGSIETVKITKPSSPNSTPDEIVYESDGSSIKEIRNGNLYRTLTMNSGNLVKVERIFKNQFSGVILGKEEMLFEGYDNKTNFLKGKYFITGAFFRAFSKNNYTKVIKRSYNFINSEYILTQEAIADFPLNYTVNNVANIFEVQCGD